MAEEKRKKILLAADEEDVLNHLGRILQLADYEVFSTTKGKEVLTLAKDISPDVIILDIGMPDMDGGAVASALAEEPSTTHIPVVFLTGILTREGVLSRGKTHRYYVIAKPAIPEEVLVLIKQILSPYK